MYVVDKSFSQRDKHVPGVPAAGQPGGQARPHAAHPGAVVRGGDGGRGGHAGAGRGPPEGGPGG